jgi:hypothetical protein
MTTPHSGARTVTGTVVTGSGPLAGTVIDSQGPRTSGPRFHFVRTPAPAGCPRGTSTRKESASSRCNPGAEEGVR